MVAPAAPTEPRANGTAKDERKGTFLDRAVQALKLPASSLVVALIIGAVVVVGIGKNPFDAYGALICGGLAIGCPEGINPAYQLSETIVSMTPLVLAGLAVAISFRAGLFNIGAQGQLLMGAIFATFAGVYLGSLPGIILIPIVILAGALGGAIWGGIVGVLKATTGANEVVTTIMLNYIALYFEKYLVVGGPFQLPNLTSTSPSISDSAKLPHLLPASGEVFGLPGSVFRVNLGIIIALLIAWGFWFLMQRTSLGYEIRAVGQSQRAARYAGVSVRSNIIVTMLIAGALAGVA
ncbi:MAG TPA: ABC transporter permease, partial [Ktedonobacterales bacterium]